MKILGCDLHAKQQSIAMVDTETGEFTEKTLLSLSILSTSAPAPSVRVAGKVFRLGACDKGIWAKSLAFATDAEELIFLYGFSMANSPFDHLIARGVPQGGSFRAGVRHNDVHELKRSNGRPR